MNKNELIKQLYSQIKEQQILLKKCASLRGHKPTYETFSPNLKFDRATAAARAALSNVDSIKDSIKNKEEELIKADERFKELFNIAKDLRPDISIEDLFNLVSTKYNYH